MASLQKNDLFTNLETQDSSHALRENQVEQFSCQGFLTPIQVLSTQACQQFLRDIDDPSHPSPMDWFKGCAANSRAFYNMATASQILSIVKSLLGNDVMLWGAQVVNRAPYSSHPWHTDIETSAPACKTVSVWIGLEHTDSESSLTVVPYSHLFGTTLQEVRNFFGKARGEETNQDVENWSQAHNPKSTLMRPMLADGKAIFFDGRLWHASYNLLSETRRALLLQYATTNTDIKIPDFDYLDWPFQFRLEPQPPCLLISGSNHTSQNRFVPAPHPNPLEARPLLQSKVYPQSLPLVLPDNEDWKPYPIFRGSTPVMTELSCHVSTLRHLHRPHYPHDHKEEEILLLLAGEVDLLLPAAPGLSKDHRLRLHPGEFVYYPEWFPHSLETVSQIPANYLLLKWHAFSARTERPLAFCRFSLFDSLSHHDGKDGFTARRLFENPTTWLYRLQCHTSTLTPGAGYPVHCDAYDIVIIVLEGELETLDERIGPHGVIFYRAGEPHGMFNPGNETAKYVVFEFHGE